jgi:hypothetical protein
VAHLVQEDVPVVVSPIASDYTIHAQSSQLCVKGTVVPRHNLTIVDTATLGVACRGTFSEGHFVADCVVVKALLGHLQCACICLESLYRQLVEGGCVAAVRGCVVSGACRLVTCRQFVNGCCISCFSCRS